MTLQQVKATINRISIVCLQTSFDIIAEYDKIHGKRIYIQIVYKAFCTKENELKEWKGAKYYLSDFMTEDEIVKKCYVAFEQAVKHEVMESFKVDKKVLFNPHVNFEELLKISDLEVRREDTEV